MIVFLIIINNCLIFVLLSNRSTCSVQAPPPSPFVLVGGLIGCSFGDGTAVLVCLAEVALAQLVFVQHAVGLLHDGTRSQLFTGHDPGVLCEHQHIQVHIILHEYTHPIYVRL